LARFTPEAAEINQQLRGLLVARVYSYAQLVEDRSAAVDKLRLLFEYFIENPEQVAPTYRERLGDEPVHRVVCDYIAGMTDAYLLRSYRELLG
jgi:dGTPase